MSSQKYSAWIFPGLFYCTPAKSLVSGHLPQDACPRTENRSAGPGRQILTDPAWIIGKCLAIPCVTNHVTVTRTYSQGCLLSRNFRDCKLRKLVKIQLTMAKVSGTLARVTVTNAVTERVWRIRSLLIELGGRKGKKSWQDERTRVGASLRTKIPSKN